MQDKLSNERRGPSTRVRRTTFSDQERAEILKLLSARNDRRRQLTEKQRRRETERARERRRKMTGEALLEWRRRHAENARRRRAALLQERIKLEERVKKTLSLQQYPKSFAFMCGLCPSSFNNRWQLTQHRAKAHRQNDGQYVCEECGKTTAKVRDMIVHKRGRHNMSFCNIYPIKNNNNNQSISPRVLQENNQLSLQGSQRQIFSSIPNSNELLSNSFHQSNFTNFLSRLSSQVTNQFQPDYFSRSSSEFMERNEITGNSYKMLTDYIKQSEKMSHDAKLNFNIGYQPIHHYGNNFDQELTNFSTSNQNSFRENYSSVLSNDLPETRADDQGYKFPLHIFNQNQFPNQNSEFYTESFRQNQISQSIYEWHYQHNQNTQAFGASVQNFSSGTAINSQETTSNISHQENSYGLKIVSVESENKATINNDSKTFSISQSSQNENDSSTNLTNELIQTGSQKWSGFESKSTEATLFKSESTGIMEEESPDTLDSVIILGSQHECDDISKCVENKPKYIRSESLVGGITKNKSVYTALEENTFQTPKSQVDSKVMTANTEDDDKNIQYPTFLNYDDKSLPTDHSNVVSSTEFVEELESEIEYCISEQPNINSEYYKVQNTSMDSNNQANEQDNKYLQISNDSCNQNKEITESQNQNNNLNAAFPEEHQRRNEINDENQIMNFSSTFEKSGQDSYICISNYLQSQSVSQRMECSISDFRNSYNSNVHQVNYLPNWKVIHLDDSFENQSVENHNISKKECQDLELLKTYMKDTTSLMYPKKDPKENQISDNSLILSEHRNLQEKIKMETNDGSGSWHLEPDNTDAELNITINNFTNFYTDDVKECINKNSNKISNSKDSKRISSTAAEEKQVKNVLSKLDDKKENSTYNEKIINTTSSTGKHIHMQTSDIKHDEVEKMTSFETVCYYNKSEALEHTSRKDIQFPNETEEWYLPNREPETADSSSNMIEKEVTKTDKYNDQIHPISNVKKENESNSKERNILISEPSRILPGEGIEKTFANELLRNANNKNVIKLIKCKGQNGVPHYKISKIQLSPSKNRSNSTKASSKIDEDSINKYNPEIYNHLPKVLQEISANKVSIKVNESKHATAVNNQVNSEDNTTKKDGQEKQSSIQLCSGLENTKPNVQTGSESVSLQIENKFPKMRIKKVSMKQAARTDEYNASKPNTTRIVRPISSQTKITLGTDSSTVTSTIKQSSDNHEREHLKENESSTNKRNPSTEPEKLEQFRESADNTIDNTKNEEPTLPELIVVGNNNNNNNSINVSGQIKETESSITTVFQVVKEVKPEGTFVYVCLPCELILHTNEEYDNHQESEHPRNNIEDQGKRIEIQLKKQANDIYMCTKCTTVFKTRKALQKHNRYKHNAADAEKKKLSRVKNHVCGVCGRKFVFGHLLQDHINSHTGDTPYTCMICGTRLSMRSELMCHVKLHRQPYI